MKVKIKKVHEDAVIPKYAKDGDAGLDLIAVSDILVKENGVGIMKTGLSVEIPKGYVGYLFPRSSISKQGVRLSNSVGVIDSGYRGEIMMQFDPTVVNMGIALAYPDKSIISSPPYKKGDKIGQLIIMPYPQIEFEEVQELSDTDRGDGGFGSTGK